MLSVTTAVSAEPTPRAADPVTSTPPLASASKKPHKREWMPHIWEGMDCFAWLRLLAANNFAVPPSHWYLVPIVSASSVMNAALRWVLNGLHGDRVRETVIERPPLFVIGHWRTGTTLLHELLIRDKQFGF